jgi:hypothetical protein
MKTRVTRQISSLKILAIQICKTQLTEILHSLASFGVLPYTTALELEPDYYAVGIKKVIENVSIFCFKIWLARARIYRPSLNDQRIHGLLVCLRYRFN